jgi:hypothetical protein
MHKAAPEKNSSVGMISDDSLCSLDAPVFQIIEGDG